MRGLLRDVNAGDPHLLKEERQFMTVRGQPLRVQRSVKTQTQSPPGIGRVLGSGFFRCQTAAEKRALSTQKQGPRRCRPLGAGLDVGG